MNVESRLAKASEIFGYIFRDKAKCAEALQMDHNPLIIDGSPLKVPKNNRPAIVGDAILDATLCKIWYGCSHANEPLPANAWSTVRHEVLGNKALHVRGESLGLGALVLVNGGHWDLPISEKMMATTFEAIFGAISVDGGEEAVLQSVKHLGMDKHIFLVGTREYPALITMEKITLLLN